MNIRQQLRIPAVGALVLVCCLCVGCPGFPQKYRVTIHRIAASEAEEAAIHVAESVYPPREEVLAAFSGSEPAPAEGDFWWYTSWDGIAIPYAITGDAVDYYLAAVNESETLFLAGQTPPWKLISLKYQATAHFYDEVTVRGDTFGSVYVVKMKLSWYSWNDLMCSLDFSANRTVVLDENLNVLQVYGDAPAGLIFS